MGRSAIIGGAVVISLILIVVGLEYRGNHPSVPIGHESRDCLTRPPLDEDFSERFARQGGRITRYPNARWQGDYLTVADIAQGRNLAKYDRLELRDREHFHPWEWLSNPVSAQARSFLWEHWLNRKRAYLVFTSSSVDHTGTFHIFLEPDDSGRWRVYWRLLNRRQLVDNPTAYSVKWVVVRNGWAKLGTPLPAGQIPDPLTNELEFGDICGEESGSF